MKVVADFNKISKEMKDMLPVIKKGEIKTFQLVTGELNRDPDAEERRKHPMLYSLWQIPTRDRVQDWGTSEFVDIGVPEMFNRNEVITTRLFMPGKGEPYHKYSGKFSLNGNNLADQEMYQYLSASNYNLSNKYRDNTVDPIFCELNAVKASREQLSKEDALLEAMNAAKNMKVVEMKQFASALVWPVYNDDDVLKAKIREYAKAHPETFNEMYSDPSTKIKAELSDAVSDGILSYNITNGTMTMGHSVLATLSVRHESNFIQAFHEYIENAANGKDILDSIRKQIKAKNKKAEVPA